MTIRTRQNKIVEIITREKSVQIPDLAKLFNVSIMTIRRDLKELEDLNLIKRVYGGAVLTDEKRIQPYFPRIAVNNEVKTKIGMKAATLIPDGSSIILDLGTSVLEMSKHLTGKKNLTVITSSIPVLNELEKYPSMEIYSIGGRLNSGEHSFTGSYTEQFFKNFCADIAFIGVGGISIEYGLTNFNHDTASLCKTIMKQAKKVVLLADSSKFDKSRPAVISNLEMVDVIVTDKQIPQQYIDYCKSKDIDVLIAD